MIKYLDFFQAKDPKICGLNVTNETVADVNALMDLDAHYYLRNNILRKTDRATMVNSVEGRLPFLFNSVADFANKESLISGFKGKMPLRSLLKKYGLVTELETLQL